MTHFILSPTIIVLTPNQKELRLTYTKLDELCPEEYMYFGFLPFVLSLKIHLEIVRNETQINLDIG